MDMTVVIKIGKDDHNKKKGENDWDYWSGERCAHHSSSCTKLARML